VIDGAVTHMSVAVTTFSRRPDMPFAAARRGASLLQAERMDPLTRQMKRI
jgi:hypothetical protein